MEIHVRPLQRTLNVAPGANLLDALRTNDVPISHSCMAGRCGTCRCKIVAGQVLDSGREVQQPLAAQDAYVLACQTFVTEPCTVEICSSILITPEAWPPGVMPATLWSPFLWSR